MKPKLYEYQKEDRDKFGEDFDRRGYCAYDMGLGKSGTSLSVRKKYGPFNRPIIVVTYASLKWNWEDECRKWGFKKTVILSGETPPEELPGKRERKSKTVYIINYDILKHWVPWLRMLQPGTVIVDESQAIKSRSAQRSKAVKLLCKDVESILMLSGTPILNQPAELWVPLNILWPKEFPSFWNFCTEYTKLKSTPWGPKPEGGKNLDQLYERLKSLGLIRRRKDDVLDLPEKTTNIIPVALPPKLMKEYTDAKNNFIRWLRGVAPHMAKNASRMKAASKMMGLKRLVAQLKMKIVIDWIDMFLEQSPDAKLIVFGIHKKVLIPLHEKYKKISVLVNGEVLGKEKHHRFNKFKRDKKCRLLFGNMQAAGTGWNGTECQEVLFIELGWTKAEHDQAADRTHRIGQKKRVNINYLIVNNTIEVDILKLQDIKQGYSDEAIDGGTHKATVNMHKELQKRLMDSWYKDNTKRRAK